MLPCSWTRALSLLCLVLSSAMAVEGQRQIPLGPEYGHRQHGDPWDVSIANEWDVSCESRKMKGDAMQQLTMLKVLGPFPIHAREQHFLSPSFPVNRKGKRIVALLSLKTHHDSHNFYQSHNL